MAKRLGIEKPPTAALLWGSVAPDLALYGLTFTGIFWFGFIKQWPASQVGEHLFKTLFYQDPIWISLHNVLHSPTVLITALLGLWGWQTFFTRQDDAELKLTRGLNSGVANADSPDAVLERDAMTVGGSDRQETAVASTSRPTIWWSWFFSSCLLHTIVDIPVHHDDGPLVFWPLNWSYRFASPISYWDPQHFGRETMIFEATLFFVLLSHLIWVGWTSRKQKRQNSPPLQH